MNVSALGPLGGLDATAEPDSPLGRAPVAAPGGIGAFSKALGGALRDASAALGRADAAESAFASGKGGMQEMVLERAQADIALSIASAAASRAATSLTTILGMQI